MGVLYSVLPLDARTRKALAQYGVTEVPAEEGRNPTPAEVRGTLGELPGYRVQYETPSIEDGSWGATVEDAANPEEGPWTHLRSREYAGEREPIELGFEKGWPDLIVRIVVRLTEACGTLVIVPDTGEAPLVVSRGSDSEVLLRTWEHVATGDE